MHRVPVYIRITNMETEAPKFLGQVLIKASCKVLWQLHPTPSKVIRQHPMIFFRFLRGTLNDCPLIHPAHALAGGNGRVGDQIIGRGVQRGSIHGAHDGKQQHHCENGLNSKTLHFLLSLRLVHHALRKPGILLQAGKPRIHRLMHTSAHFLFRHGIQPPSSLRCSALCALSSRRFTVDGATSNTCAISVNVIS